MMKRFLLFFYFIFFCAFATFAFAATHDTSLDNKSIRSLTFDDANTTGTVKIQAAANNTSDVVLTLPASTATLATTTDIAGNTITVTGAVSGSGTSSIATTLASQIAQSSNINWSDVQAQQVGKTGVNWTFQPNNTGGINWTAASNNATANNIMCWKSNGQPGKCTTGVSGTGCTGCN